MAGLPLIVRRSIRFTMGLIKISFQRSAGSCSFSDGEYAFIIRTVSNRGLKFRVVGAKCHTVSMPSYTNYFDCGSKAPRGWCSFLGGK